MNCCRPSILNLFVIVILALATLATATACSSIVDEPTEPATEARSSLGGDGEPGRTDEPAEPATEARSLFGRDGEPGRTDEPAEPATEARSLFGRGGGFGRTFVDLLELIPDSPDTRASVELNNYELAQEVLEIPAENLNDHDELVTWYSGTQSDSPTPGLLYGPWLSGYNEYGSNNPSIEYLGFRLRDVTQSAIAALRPARLEIMLGEFDPDDVDRRIQSCSECPVSNAASLFIERHGGITFYGWGGDYQMDLGIRFNPPAFDQLGQGGRIAVMPNLGFRTVETPGMRDLIDARQGDARTLAEVDEFRRIAQSLDRAGAYSAFITDDVGHLDFDAFIDGQIALNAASSEEAQRIRAAYDDATLLRPYSAFGVGAGVEGGQQFMVLVLAHDDAESASRNEELLESQLRTGLSVVTPTTWAEVFDIVDIDSRVTGNILTVKVTGFFGSTNWIKWYYNDDTLLLYE